MENNRIKHLVFVAILITAFLRVQYSYTFSVPPKPAGQIYVEDYTGTLTDANKQKMWQVASDLHAQTSAQIAVVFIDSTKGLPIDTYASALYKQWEMGGADKNGVLLLASQKDKRVKIEVGSGLAKAFTNGKVRPILLGITPYFRSKDFNSGTLYGLGKVAEMVANNYKVPLQLDASIPTTSPNQSIWLSLLTPWTIFFSGVFTVTGLVYVVVSLMSRRGQPDTHSASVDQEHDDTSHHGPTSEGGGTLPSDLGNALPRSSNGI